jgi:hypothetical protein
VLHGLQGRHRQSGEPTADVLEGGVIGAGSIEDLDDSLLLPYAEDQGRPSVAV